MNGTDIIVRSGIKPVHSFDLWGTLVIQEVMGPRVTESYARLMEKSSNQEIVRANIENYHGVLRGEKAALANKKKIVDAVEDPLWRAYLKNEIDVSFESAFYEDAMRVVNDIITAGEDVCILTTGESPWVKKALMWTNPLLCDLLVGKEMAVYSGDKTKRQTYENVAADLGRKNARMVSHTEDQLKGLTGILASDMKGGVNIIYVERANLATPDEVSALGIKYYVKDLREVPYTKLRKDL